MEVLLRYNSEGFSCLPLCNSFRHFLLYLHRVIEEINRKVSTSVKHFKTFHYLFNEVVVVIDLLVNLKRRNLRWTKIKFQLLIAPAHISTTEVIALQSILTIIPSRLQRLRVAWGNLPVTFCSLSTAERCARTEFHRGISPVTPKCHPLKPQKYLHRLLPYLLMEHLTFRTPL